MDLARPEGWTFTRLNTPGATQAPPAAGDPVQALHQGVRHIVYRDLEGGLQDLSCAKGHWQAQLLTFQTGKGWTAGPLAQALDRPSR